MTSNAPFSPIADQPVPLFPDGAYVIEGVLGSGGMAVVYRARDSRRRRIVAIKVLRAEVARAIGTDRFLREIAVTGAFTHPHILPLLDSGETVDAEGNPSPFYVTPLIEGESLAVRIGTQHRLPVHEAVRLTCEILDALRYAHDHGVIHRDIKPANVLLSDGHAVVADFGVSRPLRKPEDLYTAVGITASGVVLGTPLYMSPEQALGDSDVDARCDLYAVGCVLYEMLGGVSPFEAPTPQAIISRKVSGGHLLLSRLRQGIPPALDDLLERALAPEPSDRFESANEFLAELTRLDIRSSASSQAVRTGQAKQSPRIVQAGWVGLLLLVLAAIVRAVGQEGRQSRVPNAASSTSIAGIRLDKARIAVLPPEIVGNDSLVANTLHGDLIDELARYPALTVVSRNGVLGFTGARAVADSVARVLGSGSIISSSVRGTDDSVWVTVRLIDGTTSAQVASHIAAGRRRDVLAVRSALVDSVTTVLRRQIGVTLRRTDEQVATVADAWELVARVEAMGAAPRFGNLADRRVALSRMDALLARAQQLDPRWVRPYEQRIALLLERASLEESIAIGRRTPPSPEAIRRQAIRLADSTLRRFPNAPRLLLQRGRAALELWLAASPAASDSMRDAAESDLRAAVNGRRDLALGWYYLSLLLETNGDFESARKAAEAARLADAFLESDAELLSRLTFSALALGEVDAARRWCLEGRSRYATNPMFWTCELSVLAWTANQSSDVSAAWEALRDAERRDRQGVMISYGGQRRLLVAAVAARAGLADSARAIVRRVRDEQQPAEVAVGLDYTEAYVRTLLGEREIALSLIASFLTANPARYGYVRRTPWFSSLAGDSAFARITSAR